MTEDPRQTLDMRLSAYLDDELRPEERREVEALLERDAKARAQLEELRAAVEAVQSLPRAKAPASLMESLRSHLEREALLGAGRVEGAGRPRGRVFFRWMSAAAVMALATTAGYLTWPIAREYWRQPMIVARYDTESGQEPPPPSGLTGEDESKQAWQEGSDAPAGPPPPAMAAGNRSEEESVLALRDPAAPSQPQAPVKGDAAAIALKPGGMDSADSLPAGEQAAALGAIASVVDVAAAADQPARGAGAVVGEATVVELSFADAAQQSAALVRLREQYAFRPAGGQLGTQPRAAALLLEAPDTQSVHQIIAELQSNRQLAEKIEVLSEGASAATRFMSVTQQNMDLAAGSARDGGRAMRGAAAPAEAKEAGDHLGQTFGVPEGDRTPTPPGSAPAGGFGGGRSGLEVRPHIPPPPLAAQTKSAGAAGPAADKDLPAPSLFQEGRQDLPAAQTAPEGPARPVDPVLLQNAGEERVVPNRARELRRVIRQPSQERSQVQTGTRRARESFDQHGLGLGGAGWPARPGSPETAAAPTTTMPSATRPAPAAAPDTAHVVRLYLYVPTSETRPATPGTKPE